MMFWILPTSLTSIRRHSLSRPWVPSPGGHQSQTNWSQQASFVCSDYFSTTANLNGLLDNQHILMINHQDLGFFIMQLKMYLRPPPHFSVLLTSITRSILPTVHCRRAFTLSTLKAASSSHSNCVVKAGLTIQRECICSYSENQKRRFLRSKRLCKGSFL